jgi:hypothetical protein
LDAVRDGQIVLHLPHKYRNHRIAAVSGHVRAAKKVRRTGIA